MKRHASTKKTSAKKSKPNRSDDTTDDDEMMTKSDNVSSREDIEKIDDDFNPDLYNVDELIGEFESVDEQIVTLERRRQEVLRILKRHPMTRVKYSTVNRWEKTKEMIVGSLFHLVSSDCLGIILSFVYDKEVLDVEFVKKLSSLSSNFNKSLLQFTPFILSLKNEVLNFKESSIPTFGGLYGIEFAPYAQNLKIVERILKNSNYSIKFLSIRCDLTNSPLPSLSKEAKQSIQVMKYVESHNHTRGSLDFSTFTSLKDLYISKFKSATGLILFPANTLSRLSFSFSHCGSEVKVRQLFGVSNHLTLCLPLCHKASNNISDSTAKCTFGDSTTKTMTLIRFKTNTKKPDLMEKLTVETRFYNRNQRGDVDEQDSHSTTSTITEITGKLEKEFNFPLEIDSKLDSEEAYLKTRYVDEFKRLLS